jgi:hypothetical protein
MGGVKIECRKAFPKRIHRAREEFDDPPIAADEILPVGYTAVCVRVRARSIHAAVDAALEGFEPLRGIWNYAVNSRTYQRWTSGELTPVNRIRLGKIHTLHLPSGALAHEGYHYEPAISADRSTYGAAADINWLRKVETIIRRRIARVPYRDEMLRAFARYARALDTVDYDSALLRLWSLLEFLTATEYTNYDALVKRASFLEGDTAWARVVLQHLRAKRNSGVHADVGSNAARGLVWQLKRYVEKAFRLHIVKRGEFETRKDAADFMDLPPSLEKLNADVEALRERLRLYGRAIEFRTAPKTPAPSSAGTASGGTP